MEIEQDIAPGRWSSLVMSLWLGQNPEALAIFESLSFTCRKEYVTWIASAKKDETRNRRIGLMIDRLLENKKKSDIQT